MDSLTKQGIDAFRAGKRDEARKFFVAAVKQNQNDERVWGCMYDVCDTDKERIHCLNQMLRINQKNEKARQLLNQLTAPSLTVAPSFTQESPQSKQVNYPKPKAKNKSFNIWIASAVAIFSVAVCSCFFGIYFMYSGVQNPTNIVGSSSDVVESSSDEALTYLLKAEPIFTTLQELYAEFENEIIQFQKNPALFYDEAWRNKTNSTLEKILAESTKYESIEPIPQEFRKVDSYINQATSEDRKMVSNFRQYLAGDYSDVTYLLKVAENMDKSRVYIDLANEEMRKFSTP
jgi:hypothetical protein